MNTIVNIKFGSFLYGTDTENSDLDFKSIYLPTAREICLGNYKRNISTTRPKQHGERNTKDDIDLEVLSLDEYVRLLLEGQTIALDMLFAPEFQNNYTTKYIYDNRIQFLNKNVNKFVGYAKHQAAKYGLKGHRINALEITINEFKRYPEFTKLKDIWLYVQNFMLTAKNEHITLAENNSPTTGLEHYLEINDRKYSWHMRVVDMVEKLERAYDEYGKRARLAQANEGVDWKALSHAVRVNSEAIELLSTSKITFPRPDRQLLLDIKLGKMNYKEVAKIIEDGLDALQEAEKNSILPAEPNVEFAEDFVYNTYSKIVQY